MSNDDSIELVRRDTPINFHDVLSELSPKESDKGKRSNCSHMELKHSNVYNYADISLISLSEEEEEEEEEEVVWVQEDYSSFTNNTNLSLKANSNLFPLNSTLNDLQGARDLDAIPQQLFLSTIPDADSPIFSFRSSSSYPSLSRYLSPMPLRLAAARATLKEVLPEGPENVEALSLKKNVSFADTTEKLQRIETTPVESKLEKEAFRCHPTQYPQCILTYLADDVDSTPASSKYFKTDSLEFNPTWLHHLNKYPRDILESD
ncbi:hypothetical protein CAPTEDRAFT_198700 [Capitella teleta]|uniref:Uncharacterized protein n=1 Tax=Capitella teleta TaxID=283909 RepID=R7VB14_CAPTE|nr:hypothetical protein CAPTEDRAFT_198700 [Capitella teleta]|eukprot:ELU12900.1 hypothetical protein CAPTEDRAFT_198700 [Capitella teleta]